MDTPLCDLVLLSWNHLEQTRPCLESLLECTRVPCRLFIVDNGSEADVRAFLEAVKPRGAIQEIVVLQNETNEGFPKGMNRGIKASQAPYVCLLNNDLRFTKGWLKELVAVAEAQPHIGVVNPSSSTFGNYPPVGVSLQAYADGLQRRQGEYTEVGMCIGFCMLIKRAVLDAISGLSEEVERIFFEDEDFCMRAQQAGYQSVVAEAAYVYHAEHQTVQKMPEREALFARNRTWCEQKWGRRLRIAWARFTPMAPGSAELRTWLEQLLHWTRRRAFVHVYCPLMNATSPRELFRSVGLVPHADVHWHVLSHRYARLSAAGWILKRRKKQFDIIASPEPQWGALLQRLRWAHQADVVSANDEVALLRAWKDKSRSLRSF
jgi:GT2 family glycosyltransferase